MTHRKPDYAPRYAQSWSDPQPPKVWRCPIIVADVQCGRVEDHDGRHDQADELRWTENYGQSARKGN